MYPSTPQSLFKAGIDFFDAARTIALFSKGKPSAPFAYLAAQSLELLLKSYLLHRGSSEDQIKDIGHNLENAWIKAVEQDLSIEIKPPAWSVTLNCAHDRPYLLRYYRANTGLVTPNPQYLMENLTEVRKAVADELGERDFGNIAVDYSNLNKP